MGKNKRDRYTAPPEELLKMYIEGLERELEIKHYNYERDGKQQIEQICRDVLSRSSKETRRMLSNKVHLSVLDFDKTSLSKRSKAVAHYAQFAYDTYHEKYPDLCIEKNFIDVNAICNTISFDVLDHLNYLNYAASLWILDTLQSTGKLRKALQYLPEDYDESEVHLPPFEDSCHSESLIERMMYVVKFRGLSDGQSSDGRTFVYSEQVKNSKGKKPIDGEMTNRQRYDAIIALIRPSIIDRAVKRFADKEWEFFDLCLSCINDYRQQEIKIIKEMLQNARRSQELSKTIVDTMMDVIPKQPILQGPMSAPPNPLLLMAQNIDHHPNRSLFEGNSTQFEMNSLMLSQIENDKKRQMLDEKQFQIAYSAPNLEAIHSLVEAGHIDQFVEDKLKTLTVLNPFEICFAFLYLLDSGSELPWLYNQTIAVLQTAANQLPWAFRNVTERDWEEPDDEDYCEEDEFEEPDADEEDTDCDDPDESDETDSDDFIDWIDEETLLYTRKYTDACLWCYPDEVEPSKLLLLNLAQIIFENSDVVMPRNVSYDADLAELLVKSGFDETEAKAYERYVTLIRTASMKAREEVRFDIDDEDEPDDETESIDKLSPPEIDPDALKQEIKDLKTTLHSTHNEKNELKKKLETVSEERDNLLCEIAELRELLEQKASVDENNEPSPDIQYPYTATGRYVVYGGHPTWRKAIKQKLKNVTFTSDTELPNAGLILNSDAVWVQNNAIGHAFYYKILNLTRTHKIPVKYFSFASAEKCAEQLALYDMKSIEEQEE